MSQSHACVQSLEEVQGVLGQEMQGLKAERTKFKDLLHDAKWTASQAAGPDQASVTSALFSYCPCVESGHCHNAYSRCMHLKCENRHHMLGAQCLTKTFHSMYAGILAVAQRKHEFEGNSTHTLSIIPPCCQIVSMMVPVSAPGGK